MDELEDLLVEGQILVVLGHKGQMVEQAWLAQLINHDEVVVLLLHEEMVQQINLVHEEMVQHGLLILLSMQVVVVVALG